MISLAELRLGNWFKTRSGLTGVYIPVQVSLYHFRNPDLFKTMEPILLTPEILKAAGFKKHLIRIAGCDVWEMGEWRLAMSRWEGTEDECFSLWHEMMSPPTWTLTKIGYVHQLQNFWHSAMGQELIVDLKQPA